MKGLLYKDCVLSGTALVILLCVNSSLYVGCIVVSRLAEDAVEAGIAVSLLCFLTFFLIGMMDGEFFRYDEKGHWDSFMMSTPQNVKGQVGSKYTFVLFVCLANLFLCFAADMVAAAVRNNLNMSFLMPGFVCFCIQLLFFALELPFVLRFGAEKGRCVKYVILGVLASAVVIYVLFGDISFLFAENPLAKLASYLSGDAVLWEAALLPYISAALYYSSYIISLALYRKGVESHE